jgi:hypothetical protein
MAAFVVNSGGMTHSVNDDQVEALLQQGFRLATAEEIAAWYAAQGLEVPHAAREHDRSDPPGSRPDRRSSRR